MEVKTKSYLMIAVTLILGIIIGVAGSGLLRNYFFEKRMDKVRSPHGFIEHMEKIIQPDDTQKEQLRKKLESQQEQFTELSMKFRSEMDSLNKSFQKDLNEILTKEQQDRLTKFFERRKPNFNDKDKHFRPHPQRRPGDGPPPPPPDGDDGSAPPPPPGGDMQQPPPPPPPAE